MTSIMTKRNLRAYTQEYFEELLRESGYKVTPARLRVLDALAHADRPLSASDIYEYVSAPRYNLRVNSVTVYRSLSAFEADALIRRVPIKRDSHYYELAETGEQYFICTTCGDVQPFRTQVTKDILTDVGRAGGRVVTHMSIQVYGVCKTCAQQSCDTMDV